MKCPGARREHLAGFSETFPRALSILYSPSPSTPPLSSSSSSSSSSPSLHLLLLPLGSSLLFSLSLSFFWEINTSQTFSDSHIFRPSPSSSSTSFYRKRSTRTAEFIIICEASNASFLSRRGPASEQETSFFPFLDSSFPLNFFPCCAVDLFRFIQ